MTIKQAMYIDMCKKGYSLREIADKTGRKPKTISRVLKKAVACPDRGRNKCERCSLKSTCNANYDLVTRIRAGVMYRKDLSAQAELQGKMPKGRYSY